MIKLFLKLICIIYEFVIIITIKFVMWIFIVIYKLINNFIQAIKHFFVKPKKYNEVNVVNVKRDMIEPIIETATKEENNDEKKDKKESTVSLKMSIERKNHINKSNTILFNFQNTIFQKYDEDFPVELLNTLINKFNPMLLKFILLDTRKITFIDFTKHEYLLTHHIYTDKEIVLNLQTIKKEIDKRFNLLFEKNSKNICSYNDKCEYTKDILPFIFVSINDIFDIISKEKEVKTLIQELILKGKKVGIIFFLFTSVEDKYLKLDIVKNNVLKYNDRDYMKFVDKELTKIPTHEFDDFKNENLFYELGEKKTIGTNNIEQSINIDDPLYNEIVDFCVESGKVSASLLQRRFRLGYNRAARIIDLLEERGIIGPANGSKPREVLIKNKEIEEGGV